MRRIIRDRLRAPSRPRGAEAFTATAHRHAVSRPVRRHERAALQALVGYPIGVPILAIDRDVDPLVISVDTTAPPFSAGATFDAATKTLQWTPGVGNVGKVVARFTISDGVKQSKLSVVLKVVDPTFP